jgi:Photosynthetic reaction centre cytochrome C subunit
MAVRRFLVVAGTLVGALSCSKAPATSSPTPGTGPTATPGGRGSPAPNAGNPGTPGTVAGRRVPPSRDSLAKLRANYVATVMQSIAGHENEPADKVFKNVQVLKNLTAAQLVHKMDKDYAEALSWNCTNCHRLAPQGNFASDTSNDKKRARFMQTMQNEINQNQLPRLYPKDTPSVTCATCHRGYNEPPPGDYLAPERGKPGAPPAPPPPAGRSGQPPAGARPPSNG